MINLFTEKESTRTVCCAVKPLYNDVSGKRTGFIKLDYWTLDIQVQRSSSPIKQ